MKLIKQQRYHRIILLILILIPFVYFLLVIPESHKEKSPDKSPPVATQDKQSKQTPIATPPDQPQPKTTPEPSTRACKLFTPQLAKQILGDDATASINESIVLSETTDMQVSSCTYTNKPSETIRLEVHMPKTSLGSSTNAVNFGSGRPVGAQNAPEYGQAAFWDNNTSTLHVLKSNIHYVISRSENTLAETKKAADIIVPKL